MELGTGDYYRYWAKARSGSEDGAGCHLLPFHNLDVAAVGWCLLEPERPLAKNLADRLGLCPEILRNLLVFVLGLHDIGKFARAFQGLAQPQGVDLVPPLPRYRYSVRHDQLGAMVWADQWTYWLRDGMFGLPDIAHDRPKRRALADGLSILLAPIFGHHGQPVASSCSTPLNAFFARDETADDVSAVQAFVADWAEFMLPNWPLEKLVDPEFQQALRALSWTIAGWAVLSDWLGSNQDYFEYCDQPIPLAQYWQAMALPRARAVLTATGVAETPRPIAYTGMSAWFDSAAVTVTPLQTQAQGRSPQARGSTACARGIKQMFADVAQPLKLAVLDLHADMDAGAGYVTLHASVS